MRVLRSIPIVTIKDQFRFWDKVNRTDGCWLWTGYTMTGYPMFKLANEPYLATRVSWKIHNGEPGQFYVLHDCPIKDNPLCVNPAHLWLGDQFANMQDCSLKGGFRNRSSDYKLWPEEKAEIRKLYATGEWTLKALAIKFDSSITHIHRIVQS